MMEVRAVRCVVINRNFVNEPEEAPDWQEICEEQQDDGLGPFRGLGNILLWYIEGAIITFAFYAGALAARFL